MTTNQRPFNWSSEGWQAELAAAESTTEKIGGRTKITSAGCGNIGPLGEVCDVHITNIEFDGFTVHWHGKTSTSGRSLWRR